MSSKIRNIPALDGLRGIAVLVVMFYHCKIKNFFYGGFIGVDIFFVISGFLITSILLKEWDRKSALDLKQFYIRRARRLLPALLLVLTVYVSVGIACSGDVRSFLSDAGWALSYVGNWASIYSASGPDFLGHTWSLSIEEQFYIIWPLLLLGMLAWVKSRNRILALILLAMAVFAGLRWWLFMSGSGVNRCYFGLDTRADSILAGCATAFVYLKIKDSIDEAKLYLMQNGALAAAGVLFVLAMCARYYDPTMICYGYFIAAILSAVIVLYLPFAKEGLLHSILNSGYLIRIGKISYGLYLWHYPILRMLQDHFALHGAITLLIGMPLSFLAAIASYELIEKRFLATSASSPAPSLGLEQVN